MQRTANLAYQSSCQSKQRIKLSELAELSGPSNFRKEEDDDNPKSCFKFVKSDMYKLGVYILRNRMPFGASQISRERKNLVKLGCR